MLNSRVVATPRPPNNDDSRQTPITKHTITNTRHGVPTTTQPQSPMKKIPTPSPSPSKATLQRNVTHGTPPGPKDLVGSRVRVKWFSRAWYQGTVVKATNSKHGLHEVKYDPDKSGTTQNPYTRTLAEITGQR